MEVRVYCQASRVVVSFLSCTFNSLGVFEMKEGSDGNSDDMNISNDNDHKPSLYILLQMLAQQDSRIGHLEAKLGKEHDAQHFMIAEMISKNQKGEDIKASVLEKTLSGVLWTILLGVGIAVWGHVKNIILGK